MSLKKLSLGDLAIWANKCEAHIVDLKELLNTIQATKSLNKFYDNDGKKANVIVLKLNEVTDIMNKIYAELDERSRTQLGVDFEVQKFTDMFHEIDGAYLKQKRIQQENIEKEQKGLVELKPKK